MTAQDIPSAFDIDASPTRIEAGECPWAVHQQLRDRGAVVRQGRPDGQITYAVTGYDDVVAGLQDTRFSKDSERVAELFPEVAAGAKQSGFVLTSSGSRHLLNTDPPDHTRLRRLVQRAFTPRRIEALKPRIQQVIDELLDGLEKQDVADLIDGFAFQLSITMICELLGVPSERRSDFRDWSVATTTPPAQGSLESHLQGTKLLHDFLADLIATRRAELEDVTDARNVDNLLSAMILARDNDEGLSDSELLGMAFVILVAGHETTVGLIGTMIRGLAIHPDQRELLVNDPDLLPNAVEEFLRFEGPVQRSTFRVAIEDVELAGYTIPAGSVVSMMIGSANHDPRQFDDPDTIDVTRQVDRHVAFGQGMHFCLGAPLARMETRLAVGTILARYPNYELAEPSASPQYVPSVIRALAALPVRLRPDGA